MKSLGLMVLVLSMTLSCKKDSLDIIPNVRFNAEINLDSPQYSGSNPFIIRPNGVNRYIGVKGVVVWETGLDKFYAFDLMCTHRHDNGAVYLVEIVKAGDVILECPACHSKFNVAVEYGSVTEGPAQWPLKRYQTSVSGNNVLRIWN